MQQCTNPEPCVLAWRDSPCLRAGICGACARYDHKSLDTLLQWFGFETAKQHVWGGP